MHPIIYDVSVSLDGYISGPAGDISNFAHDGPVVDDYTARMAQYSTALMGRATYEFGYRFGMTPGQNPYPHMKTCVYSSTLNLPKDKSVDVNPACLETDIQSLKRAADGPIYLCGGGAFAGWMLSHGLIDRVILKRAPCILGSGVKLFGTAHCPRLNRIHTTPYENGYLLEEFET